MKTIENCLLLTNERFTGYVLTKVFKYDLSGTVNCNLHRQLKFIVLFCIGKPLQQINRHRCLKQNENKKN